jgi:putative membrane protein insertion efficiency factor
VKRFLTGLLLAPIRAYQRFISPALPRRCKYEPTCSAYAVDAVREFGVVRGLILAGWRLLRCNPFSHGGYDPVEAQTLFKRSRREAAA